METGNKGILQRINMSDFESTCHENFRSSRKRFGRRWFLGSVLGATLLPSRWIRTLAAAPIKSQPDVVVYHGTYPGWPWVTRTPGGRLLCVFRDDGRHNFSPTGKVLFTESRDGGRSWTPARVVADEPGVDDRNAAICALTEEDLLVCYNTYKAKTRIEKASDEANTVSQVMVVRSGDGGRSWSNPLPVSHLNARARSAPIRLTTGELLLPIYRAPGNGSLAAISTLEGRDWDVVAFPDGPGYVGDEWDVLEVEPGRLIGIHRNSHPDTQGFFWKTESRDGGRTWSRAVRTNVQSARYASPAQIDRHGDHVVLTYADERLVSVSMVTTEDPDYIRWNIDGRLPCYQYRPDGRPIPDGSYPVSVRVSGRKRFIVDYQIDEGRGIIAGYFVTLPSEW